MSFSFNENLPTNKDKVRFYIGDIESNQKQVDDETIEAILDLVGDNVYSAAATICEHLSAKFAKIKHRRGGVTAINFASTASDYAKLARKFRMKATLESGGTGFIMPSISEAAKKANRDDTDLTQASFSRNIHDHPEVNQDVISNAESEDS